jgi:hypothetical protein
VLITLKGSVELSIVVLNMSVVSCNDKSLEDDTYEMYWRFNW